MRNPECVTSPYGPVVDAYLKQYRQQIDAATDEADATAQQKRLYASVHLCQKLTRLHPLNDGNCRVLCTILPSRLWLHHGESLTIVEDPNKFDAHSRAQIFCKLIEGQSRVDKWRKTGEGKAPASRALPGGATFAALERWLKAQEAPAVEPSPARDLLDIGELDDESDEEADNGSLATLGRASGCRSQSGLQEGSGRSGIEDRGGNS